MKDKKILFFTRCMQSGGTENVILKLCRILHGEGYQAVVCSNGGINVEQLRKWNIMHYMIPDITKRNPVVMLSVFIQLWRIIRKEKIEIVHTHHRMAAFYMQFIRKIKPLSVIGTVHNTFYDKKRLTRFSYDRVKLVAVGEKVKENLCCYYQIPEDRVTVIFNGIEEFSGQVSIIPDIEKYRDQGFFLVGNIGRLSKQKGFKYFIHSIPLVLSKVPKVKFFIVGSGEDREELERTVRLKKLTNDVVFLGYRDDIQNVMIQMDLIVLSSLWEGLPLTPIEAFSVGKTVVATAVDGTTEIVRDGIDGCLVEPGNAEMIADKILYLIEHPDVRAAMEQNAEVRYREKFSYAGFVDSYIRFYEGL